MNFKALSDRELSDLLHKKEEWLERLNHNMQGNYDEDDPDERYVEELRQEIKQIKAHFDKRKQEELEKLSDEKLEELFDQEIRWLTRVRNMKDKPWFDPKLLPHWTCIVEDTNKKLQNIELILNERKYGPGAGGVG